MFDKIKAMAAAVDEEESFPAQGMALLAQAGLTAPKSAGEGVWAVYDTARVCASTAACLAVTLAVAAAVSAAAREGVSAAEKALSAAKAGKPVSVCRGEVKAEQSGEKTLLSGALRAAFAPFAEYYVIVSDGEEPEAWLAEKNAPGLAAGLKEEKLGLRGLVTAPLTLEGVPVLPLGRAAALEAEHRLWLYMAAVSNGLLAGGAAEAAAHAYGRVQFKKRITEFENTRCVMADCLAGCEAGRALLEKAALACAAEDPRWPELAAMAKLFCGEAACAGMRKCVQVMSGRGYMRDFPEEVRMRDAKTAQIFYGSPERLRFFIADGSGVN